MPYDTPLWVIVSIIYCNISFNIDAGDNICFQKIQYQLSDCVKKDTDEIWTSNLLYSNWFFTHWATFQTNITIICSTDSKWIFFHLLAKIRKNRQFLPFSGQSCSFFQKNEIIAI